MPKLVHAPHDVAPEVAQALGDVPEPAPSGTSGSSEVVVPHQRQHAHAALEKPLKLVERIFDRVATFDAGMPARRPLARARVSSTAVAREAHLLGVALHQRDGTRAAARACGRAPRAARLDELRDRTRTRTPALPSPPSRPAPGRGARAPRTPRSRPRSSASWSESAWASNTGRVAIRRERSLTGRMLAPPPTLSSPSASGRALAPLACQADSPPAGAEEALPFWRSGEDP
jgi:hypothetical protein